MAGTILNSKPSRSAGLRRAGAIALVAMLVLAPGAVAIWLWPRFAKPARVNQAPAVPIRATGTADAANPLASFDLRDTISSAERVKLWVTPPGSPLAFGVEFMGKSGRLVAVISHRGSAERSTAPISPGWIDRLNEAVRKPPAPLPDHAYVTADLYVERPGEVPGKYAVRFDSEGVGWAVMEEILSHYGLAVYVVRKGDTPAKIAEKLLGDTRRAQEIVEMNPGLEPGKLKPGDAIHVPKR